MSVPIESLEVQIESPVDFPSLNRNDMLLESLISAQELFPYFSMLNGPTYVELVKDFWVRAEVYDEEASMNEEIQAVINDPSLKGKTREEMGLEAFKETEIRSAVMGVPITITEEIIAKACRTEASGRFLWNSSKRHALVERYTSVLLKGNPSTKLVDIDPKHRMLLKFLTECFLQKGGGSDQPSVDHKLVLYFLASFDKINLPRYIMHHLCWEIKEGIRSKRKQVPCGRLLSEIFTQGQLVKTLKNLGRASDKFLKIKTGKIINGKTLQYMKIIKKFSPHEKDLKESSAPTELMKDFPPIITENNPEVMSKLIAEFVNETGDIMVDADTPADDSVAPPQDKKRRTTSEAESEAAGSQTKKAKGNKSDTPKLHVSSSSKKRTRVDPSPLVIQEKLEKAREERAKKKKTVHDKCELSKVKMTPKLSKEAGEETKRLLAERKKQEETLKAERDAKLKSIGLDGSSDFIEEKLEEVAQISKSIEELAVKKVVLMLEQIPEASEAVALEVVASEATQTSVVPTTNPTPSSSDSDLNVVPISQKLKSLQKPSSTTQQTTLQTTLQEEQTSTIAEAPVDPEETTFTDLPTCDSPLNLHSLEKHLGGELQQTPEKATKAVPEKTDLVNQQQQQPKPPQQTTHEQTLTSTQITQTQTTSSPQKTIPEPVVETVVPKSVPATTFEQTVAIIVSEPIQTTTQPSSTAITNDQPSSSSSTIQTLQQPPPPPNMLKSEYLDAELMAITTEVQRLVEQRRSPTLHLTYQEQWDALQTRVSELLNFLSQKCNKIHKVAAMHYATLVHFVEGRDPLLLANTPFFPASEYFTREGRLFKQFK